MKRKSGEESYWYSCCGGNFCGWILLIIGLWFLAKELGWVSLGVSIWPIILIIFGIWLLVKRRY